MRRLKAKWTKKWQMIWMKFIEFSLDWNAIKITKSASTFRQPKADKYYLIVRICSHFVHSLNLPGMVQVQTGHTFGIIVLFLSWIRCVIGSAYRSVAWHGCLLQVVVSPWTTDVCWGVVDCCLFELFGGEGLFGRVHMNTGFYYHVLLLVLFVEADWVVTG